MGDLSHTRKINISVNYENIPQFTIKSNSRSNMFLFDILHILIFAENHQ